ncbi:MAG TPA: GlsB/YeaQ/YmgE family stress response membrane protein [Blastocatellia bacterium]
MTLTLQNLIVLIIIGGLTGMIGERLAGYSHLGCLTAVALGFIGALIGSWAVKQFDLPILYTIRVGTTTFPVIWAIIGSAVLVAVLSLLRRRRYV